MEKFKGGGKILLGLREIIHSWGCRGWAGSNSNALKLSLIPHIFSWFLVMIMVPFRLSNPTSWLSLGSVPSIQSGYFSSFSQARLRPFVLPFWFLLPCPKVETPPPAPSWLLSHVNFCYVIWFLLRMCQQRNLPSSLSATQYHPWPAAPLGRFPDCSVD